MAAQLHSAEVPKRKNNLFVQDYLNIFFMILFSLTLCDKYTGYYFGFVRTPFAECLGHAAANHVASADLEMMS